MKTTDDYKLAISEVTPLSATDCMYIIDRYKDEFTYPLHTHSEFEINFIENAANCVRVVGDTIETIGDYDLVILGGDQLEHAWYQGDCISRSIHEITVQFSDDLFAPTGIIARNQFSSIRKMLEDSKCGLSFPLSAIMKVYPKLIQLSEIQDRFYQFIKVIEILYELSLCKEPRKLSNSTFSKVPQNSDSRRVNKTLNYIAEHYLEKLSVETLSELVNMSPTAFSRFFKVRTGKSVVDYIIDQRIGMASRLLVDTTKSILEICYESGFNNITNFNRVFKKRKNITPKEFRALYRKKRFIV